MAVGCSEEGWFCPMSICQGFRMMWSIDNRNVSGEIKMLKKKMLIALGMAAVLSVGCGIETTFFFSSLTGSFVAHALSKKMAHSIQIHLRYFIFYHLLRIS